MPKYKNRQELIKECGARGKPAKTWCQKNNIPGLKRGKWKISVYHVRRHCRTCDNINEYRD